MGLENHCLLEMDMPYLPIIKSLTIKLQSKTNIKEDVCFHTTIFFELLLLMRFHKIANTI